MQAANNLPKQFADVLLDLPRGPATSIPPRSVGVHSTFRTASFEALSNSEKTRPFRNSIILRFKRDDNDTTKKGGHVTFKVFGDGYMRITGCTTVAMAEAAAERMVQALGTFFGVDAEVRV